MILGIVVAAVVLAGMVLVRVLSIATSFSDTRRTEGDSDLRHPLVFKE